MEIKYLGHSCFRLKGKKTIIITDPYQDKIGLSLPRVSADIVTVSHQHEDHNNFQAVGGTVRRGKPFVIDGPGEYEIGHVFVNGIASWHDKEKGKERGKNTIYLITLENMRIVHLGDLGGMLSEKKLETINGVDILFVPVGGKYTINAKEAVKLVDKIQPNIVIPMHYAAKGLAFNLDPVDLFLKEMEIEVKPQAKLIASRESLPEEREVVLLSKKG